MNSRDGRARTAIAEQASEWFVMNDEKLLSTEESGALVGWLKASPIHVEEFLSVAAIARDLHAVDTDAAYSMEALIARAQADSDDGRIRWLGIKAPGAGRNRRHFRWYAMAAGIVVATFFLGLMLWDRAPGNRIKDSSVPTALHLQTRHGEQRSYRLADNTVVHLNTETALTVRYAREERLVVLTSGEAVFEVAHESRRAFRVRAGPAEIVDLGTRFDVRLKAQETVVTVLSGRVAVEPPPDHAPSQAMELGANQQVIVADGQWPILLMAVDASRTTAWMHRQIVFDHEPLARVAAEFNRYAAKPVEITAPELRVMEVSGVFSTDNADEFLAFLRSLDGVRVEVTATRIRVSHK